MFQIVFMKIFFIKYYIYRPCSLIYPRIIKNLGRIHGFHSIFLKPTRKDEIKIIFSKNRKKLSDFKIFNHQKYDILFFKNRFSRPFNITSKKSFFTDDRSGVYSNYNDMERSEKNLYET